MGEEFGLQVRPAEAADAEQLLDLWWQLTVEGTAADPRYVPRPDARASAQSFITDSWLAEGSSHHAVVADAGHGVVGFIVVRPADPHPLLDLPPTLLVTDAVVAPPLRRQGIGRSLVQVVRVYAEREGFRSMEVGTLALDARAIAFWRSVGFRDWRVMLEARCG